MDNLRAIGLMCLAMGIFAASDAGIKVASATVSTARIILFLAVVGTAMFAVLVLARGLPLFSRRALHPAVIFRCGCEVAGSIGLIGALAIAPFAFVTAIFQATPLVVTMGAALVLRERVGPRRWCAVIVGLAGVLIILRPTEGGSHLGAALALLATVALGARDVSTRRVPRDTPTPQLAFWGFAVLVPTGLILSALDPTPVAPADEIPWLALVVAMLGAAGGYYAVTAAMRIGEVSLVTPFRYTRLLFALVIAIAFFGERPDATTLIGATIVIASGLFILLRERALPRPSVSR